MTLLITVEHASRQVSLVRELRFEPSAATLLPTAHLIATLAYWI